MDGEEYGLSINWSTLWELSVIPPMPQHIQIDRLEWYEFGHLKDIDLRSGEVFWRIELDQYLLIGLPLYVSVD